jgi:hypothetical protein
MVHGLCIFIDLTKLSEYLVEVLLVEGTLLDLASFSCKLLMLRSAQMADPCFLHFAVLVDFVLFLSVQITLGYCHGNLKM